MKKGDLVAIRFDDLLTMGIITGRSNGGREYSFIFTNKRDIMKDALPSSRFVRIRSSSPFMNLCNVDWDTVDGVTNNDRRKLRKWINMADTKPTTWYICGTR